MPTLIHRRVKQAQSGDNPKVITRMKSGWVVLGDVQFVDGYCLLLPDPVVPTLNDLTGEHRTQFLEDMALLGDALLTVTKADRINYEMLGNVEQALHAHLFPRYSTENENLKERPVWYYDWEAAPQFNREIHWQIMSDIKTEVDRRMAL